MQLPYEQIDAMNSSTLKHGLRSMLRMKRVIDGDWKLESDAAKIGTAIHCLVLEPDDFDKRYCELPAFELSEENKTDKTNKRSTAKTTKFYKSAVNEFMQQREHMTILNSGQMGVVQKAARSAKNKPSLQNLLSHPDTKTEVTLLGEIEGVECKARLDLVNVKLGRLVDLKTCSDASENGFGRDFAKFRYGFQLAFYRELYQQNFGDVPDVNVIAVETSEDYDCANHAVPECILDTGLMQVRKTMQRYKRAKQTNVWPGVDAGKTVLDLYVPQWSMEDAGEELDWSSLESNEAETEPCF